MTDCKCNLDELDADELDRLAHRLASRLAAQTGGLLTPQQAAQRAGVHRETILRAVRTGKLPASHAGRAVRIATDDLEAWLNASHGRPARREHHGRNHRRPMADALTRVR